MKVKVYTTNADPYCEMVRNLLSYHSVDFENIDVSKNEVALKEMVEISGQKSVPVLDVNGKIFVGFDRQKIKELLKLK